MMKNYKYETVILHVEMVISSKSSENNNCTHTGFKNVYINNFILIIKF